MHQTAPQSVGRVLDSGFELFRECLSKVFLLALISSLVTAPASLVGPRILLDGLRPEEVGPIVGGFIVMLIVFVVLSGAMLARIDAVARAATLSMRDALALSARRLPSLIVSGSFCCLALLVGSLMLLRGALTELAALQLVGALLAVFGSIVVVWLAFGPAAVIVEGLGAFESLSYSRTIVVGHWWRIAGLLTIVSIFLLVFDVLAEVVTAFADLYQATMGTRQLPWFAAVLLGSLPSAVGLTLLYASLLSIFYDLKARHEGGDLAARIAAIH